MRMPNALPFPFPERRLVLASRSPRRRTLLEELGWDFQVLPADESAECGLCSRETPPEFVARLARQKATNVATKIEDGIVLACDTVAVCHGQVLGKPADIDDAHRMLNMLRGCIHQVFTGICLWAVPEQVTDVAVEKTELMMDRISDAQLKAYLKTRLWEGKAGAFGYQDGWDWLKIQSGSESNVVGLPIERLQQMLADLRYSLSKS